jgi:iron(III) transport system substrate-binding protein
MMRRLLPFVAFLLLVGVGVWIAVRPAGEPAGVTVYAAVDEEFAKPILDAFTKETGIQVNLVTDTEATKTVGLANTLIEEGAPGRTPRADVFWNNEPVWTTRLAEDGVLERYDSPAARDVPAAHRDPAGFWTANGLRARVFIAHAASVKARKPASYLDLADPAFKDLSALARPLAGTSLSHLAALRSLIGADAFGKWLRDAAANGAAFASSNGTVAREVGRGTKAFGFTDTDDFHGRRAAGDPVEVIFPDQGAGQVGTFVLPITVSLVRGGPHPRNARTLYDWLVSPAAEAALSATDYATTPVRPGTKPGPGALPGSSFRAATPSWSEAAKNVDAVLEIAREILQGKSPEPAKGK